MANDNATIEFFNATEIIVKLQLYPSQPQARQTPTSKQPRTKSKNQQQLKPLDLSLIYNLQLDSPYNPFPPPLSPRSPKFDNRRSTSTTPTISKPDRERSQSVSFEKLRKSTCDGIQIMPNQVWCYDFELA